MTIFMVENIFALDAMYAHCVIFNIQILHACKTLINFFLVDSTADYAYRIGAGET